MTRNFSRPQLVTIEGEDLYDPGAVAELMGIDYEDADAILTGNMSVREFEERYPEYMGVAPLIIAKIAGGIFSGIKGIVNAVKNAKAKKQDAKNASTAAAAKAALDQAAAIEQKKRDDQKKMLMLAIPAAGVLMFMAMRK